MLRKIMVQTTIILASLNSVLAHAEQNQSYSPGMMMWGDGGSWMHNTGHMIGYNMWGMGWFGLIPGLLIWILVALGIIYLYQKITEE